MTLGSKDSDDRMLLELMFKTNNAWRAEYADGAVIFRPVVIKDEKSV